MYAPALSLRTPVSQQRQPGLYYRRAAQLAHRRGLLFVAGAATDLVSALAPATPQRRWDTAFLSLRLAASGARYADAYAIQAPGTGVSPAQYATFVGAAAAQASKAHSDVELIGGLSTTAKPSVVGLLDDALAIKPPVTGYWLQGSRSAATVRFLAQLDALDG